MIYSTSFQKSATQVATDTNRSVSTITVLTRTAIEKLGAVIEDKLYDDDVKLDIEELINDDAFLEVVKQELMKKPITKEVHNALIRKTPNSWSKTPVFTCPVCLRLMKDSKKNVNHIEKCRAYYEKNPMKYQQLL